MNKTQPYWHKQFGRIDFNRATETYTWQKDDGTWYGQFTDWLGTVVNLPLSEVSLYNFQDVEFVVVAEVVLYF